jgi:hypothetical protein
MLKPELAVPKGMKVKKPHREPDMISKRGVSYWFGPDWVRDLNGTIGRVIPLKAQYFNWEPSVELNMLSKDGNISVIQGSIQREFLQWHTDQALDAILLGFDEDQIISTNWQYV